ncbi:proline--tRNA ligase [Candidatus Peregrinibacteria bacterium]|nr:MAG: proline--tRNA ligase [Candidatus Peregrinibacteria bacterium]
MAKIASQAQDFSQWYQDVVNLADLAQHSRVKGCMIIRPYGYAIWENIQRELDRLIKGAGVQNMYFPMFIPQSLLNKEKDHLEGFAPECAVVTHGGGQLLAEPLIVRPTSETIMYDAFSGWVQSHRDLPLRINQWANVVRWEMRTRPFLRTTEFLWQEGHTAHATKEEAEAEVLRALTMYQNFDKDFLALPVLTGKKSPKETFAGADYTLTTEALARDGKVIQAGTSHLLGQTFAKTFDIQFQDEKGEKQYVWQTSWGLSTRIIGTLIVCHGDEKGLVLPPKVAPHQVVLIPIYKTEEERAAVLSVFEKMQKELEQSQVRVQLDARDTVTPGFKFNEWEVKGVPLRIEVGPRDLAAGTCILARRDTGEKKSFPLTEVTGQVPSLLELIQVEMLARAEAHLAAHIFEASDLDELVKILDEKGGFVKAAWAGTELDEKKIQEQSKATIRVISEEKLAKPAKCIFTGKETDTMVYFARAY